MTYQLLAAVITDAGFYATSDFETKMICASKIRPDGGYTGNSFWVARRASGWFLGTWGPHLYSIPDTDRIPELCVEWLRRHPDGTAYDVDPRIREEFHLIEIDPENLPDE